MREFRRGEGPVNLPVLGNSLEVVGAPGLEAQSRAGYQIADGPGYQDLSLSLMKDSYFSDTTRLQFRAEFFNALNHANFDLPDIFYGSPTFGRINSAQNPRRIQFGIKVIF